MLRLTRYLCSVRAANVPAKSVQCLADRYYSVYTEVFSTLHVLLVRVAATQLTVYAP